MRPDSNTRHRHKIRDKKAGIVDKTQTIARHILTRPTITARYLIYLACYPLKRNSCCLYHMHQPYSKFNDYLLSNSNTLKNVYMSFKILSCAVI